MNRMAFYSKRAATDLMIGRLERELQLTDQILSPDLEEVTISTGETRMPAPAWTSPDGRTITIVKANMPAIDGGVSALAVWLGTNAHELGHALFSPRRDTPLMQRVLVAEQSTHKGIARVWNILEDQRQERLLIGRFRAWKGYLLAALGYHIQVTNASAWVLLAGRTWLPRDVRMAARAEFAARYGDQLADDVAALIGGYQVLADPGEGEADVAWALTSALYTLLSDGMPPSEFAEIDPGCDHKSHLIQVGEPDTSDEATTAAEAIDVAGDDTDGGGDGDGGDETDDGGDGGDVTDDGGGGGDETDDGEAESGQEAGNVKGQAAGNGVSLGDSIRDAVQRATEDALREKDTAEDLRRIAEALDHGRPGVPDGPIPLGRWREPSTAAWIVERDLTDVLTDIRDEVEAAWIRRVDSGRFSVRRWACDPNWNPDTAFDLYEPGNTDATSLDVTLVLDISSSMIGSTGALGEAAWAIRRAIDAVEGRCTVLTYHDAWALLASPDDRPDDRVFVPHAVGGTNPVPAVTEAMRVAMDSDLANRIVIVLTDGQWMTECYLAVSGMVDLMRRAGVVCAGALLGSLADPLVGEWDAMAHITTPHDLVPLFREIAVAAIRNRIAGGPS